MQESFGDYKVLERVGAGSKAEVFRARDTRAGRTAAIKVLTSDLAMDPVAGAPFVDDAYLGQKLGHPNAATLYDIGEQDGRPHLVYEFIQGQTLTSLLAGQPINPRRALELATQIADALADAHALGLVHRGLRPEKVMISLKGSAKVLDFGLGHYATAVTRQLAAAGGASAATAARLMSYWAPEQQAGLAEPRSDIYALGLVLVEMLTGRAPAGHGRAADVNGAPAVVLPILSRMLAADVAQRVDSAATVAAELRQALIVLDAQRETPREAAHDTARESVTPVPPVPPPAAAPPPVRPPERNASASPVASAAPAPAAGKVTPPLVAPPASIASPATTATPAVQATPPAPRAAAPGTAAASVAPTGKKPRGVTVTSPAKPAASAPATAPPTSGKKVAGQKGRAQPAKAAPASRPSAPPRSAPGAADQQTIDVSGLGKTTVVIVIGVALLMFLVYLMFGR